MHRVRPVPLQTRGELAPASCRRERAAASRKGILMLVPATTCASSERPFAAASARVVKLLAAAIDQRVSPGSTVWTT